MTNANKTVWNKSRDELIFNNQPGLYQDYVNASDVIVKAGINNVGLIIGCDTWEYPLWRYLRLNKNSRPRVASYKIDSIQPEAEGLFLLGVSDEKGNTIRFPYVFNKNKANSVQWNIIYPYNAKLNDSIGQMIIKAQNK
jgi:hypothetical protein